MNILTKKAFTLIEVMTVIAIIGILSSIVLISLSGAKTKSRDKANFIEIASSQSGAYKCVRSGIVDVRISNPSSGEFTPDAGEINPKICYSGASPTYASVAGFPAWPKITTGGGFAISTSAPNRFQFCSPDSLLSSSTAPAACSTFADGTCGQHIDEGKFCYMLGNYNIKTYGGGVLSGTNKIVYCTQDGCAACSSSGCSTNGF